MSDINHLPYEEEAKLMTDIINFFTERLPHATGDALELLDEAALGAELFENLSARTTAVLAELGIERDDLSRVSAAAAGLFIIAHKNKLG